METSSGLGKWLVQCLMALPQMEGLRRLMLITGGAERMYEKYAGFRMAKQGEFPPYTPPNPSLPLPSPLHAVEGGRKPWAYSWYALLVGEGGYWFMEKVKTSAELYGGKSADRGDGRGADRGKDYSGAGSGAASGD